MKWRAKDSKLARALDAHDREFWEALQNRYGRVLSPKMLDDAADDEISRFGWTTYVRSSGTPLSGSGTTWRNRIALPNDFYRRKPELRAWLKVHELGHVRQRKRWGNVKFEFRYLLPRPRTAIELQCYRETMYAMVATGETRRMCKAKAEQVHARFKVLYKVDVDDSIVIPIMLDAADDAADLFRGGW